jgi:hypothetical protein
MVAFNSCFIDDGHYFRQITIVQSQKFKILAIPNAEKKMFQINVADFNCI